jgi:hypothetical protein
MSDRRRSPVARIVRHGGTPTLTLDGRPVSALAYVGDIPDLCAGIGQTGMRLCSFVTRCHFAFFPNQPEAAAAGDRVAEHDRTVRDIVRVWPEVLFFPRMQCEAPSWWHDLYPDEAAQHELGDGLAVRRDPRKHGIPSWASQVWREQTVTALKGYIDHVRTQDYGRRFIGYHLASGTSAEWMAFGSNAGQLVDYSKPGVRAWRSWLRATYADDPDALRNAWRWPGVDFETAPVPAYRDRTAFDGQWLLDPAASQPIIDYFQFTSDLTAETIGLLAREVKEHTNHEAFVGVFYGYVLQLCNEQRQQNAGHMALRTVLECPYIDFLASPSHYGDRRSDTGYTSFMSLTESVRQHGKLWYNENDFMSPLGSRGAEDSCAESVAEYVEIQKACYAAVVCGGVSQWLLGFNERWYDHPDILTVLRRQQEIDAEALQWDRTSTNDVAVIVEDRSQLYQPVANVLPRFPRDSASRWLIYDLPPRMGRCGAGVDWILLEDLDRVRPYKAYIVLNAFALDERIRGLLRLRVCGHGAKVLWMYAPGAISIGEGLSAGYVSELTGMAVRMSREAAEMNVALERVSHPLLMHSMMGVDHLGYRVEMAPQFWIEDSQVTVLGRSPLDGRATLAVREFDGWTSVYLSRPVTLDERFIREFARWAGAHIYYEGADATYIGPNLIGIRSQSAGLKRITLPFASRVRELYSDRMVGEQVTTIEAEMKAYHTLLYRFERVG